LPFWVYVAGPVVGAALGALAYQFVRGGHPAPVHLVEPARVRSTLSDPEEV
jgi:hypothetical protein